MKDSTVVILGLGSAVLTLAFYFITKSLTGSMILGYIASAIVPCVVLPVVNKLYPPDGKNKKPSKDTEK